MSRPLVYYKENHAVCFVRDLDYPSLIYGLSCGNTPIVITQKGDSCWPIDWTYCPDWDWTHYDIGLYLDNLATGRVEWCEGLEWYEATHYLMAVSTGLSGFAESLTTRVFPVSIANVTE